MSILLNLYELLTTVISFLYPTHNKVVGGGVYWFHSVCLSVHPSHMLCPIFGLLPTFISATDQCMHHRCVLYLWGEVEEIISNCRSFAGDAYQPCLTTLMHLGRQQWNVVCVGLMSVAILEWISIHMTCALCRAQSCGGIKCVLQKTTVSHVHHGMISPGTCFKLTHWPLEELNEIWMSNFQTTHVKKNRELLALTAS